jgi:hypothetical protein
MLARCLKSLTGLVLAICAIVPGGTAAALDINGAWVTDLGICDKVLVKRGARTDLAPNSDLYGSGFVIDGASIRGKIASCKITSRRENGSTVHIQAACATDILVSANQFSLTMVRDGELVRAYPGIPEMDTSYFRCP